VGFTRLTAVIAAVVWAVLVSPASATDRGPCLPSGGPQCTFWYAKVTLVADGDTIEVDIAGDGTHALRRVRMAGYNAMELTRYSHDRARRRGACHGVAATNRLEELIRQSHWHVRLAAQHASSRGLGGRLRRQVSVLVNGQWVDVGPIMLAEGRALWFAASDEWVWNRSYAAYARQAAAAGRGLWNPQGCGAGPSANVTPRLRVQYHGRVNERVYLNTEWVQVVNPASSPVSLRDWWIRDSSLLRYTFPPTAVVPAGGRITLHIGRGTDRPGRKYFWGLASPPFNNPSYDRIANGDGAYLFDPRGNVRAWVMWGG
jgi:micrococcal nuclease